MTSILRTIMVVVATVGAISFFAPWFEVLKISPTSLSALDNSAGLSVSGVTNPTSIPPHSEIKVVGIQMGYHVVPSGWIYFVSMVVVITFSIAWPRLVGLPSALPVWAASTLAFGIMALAVAPNMTFAAWGSFVALTTAAIVCFLSFIAFISAWKAALPAEATYPDS